MCAWSVNDGIYRVLRSSPVLLRYSAPYPRGGRWEYGRVELVLDGFDGG